MMEGFVRTRDRAFIPEIGGNYEIHFGHVTVGDQAGFAMARICAVGIDPTQWIDLDTGEPLSPALRVFVVQAYKRI